jgi:hypothetical protein
MPCGRKMKGSSNLQMPNKTIHRMSGKHICWRLGWLRMPLIGDLHRSAEPEAPFERKNQMGKSERSLAHERNAVLRGALILAFIILIILMLLGAIS